MDDDAKVYGMGSQLLFVVSVMSAYLVLMGTPSRHMY